MGGSEPRAAQPGHAAADHRRGPRRRGEALQRAIFSATLAELAEAGYADLTMDRVAQRAHTSKASLYRRWPGRAELVVDAVRSLLPPLDDLPDTGSLRADALALLRRVADWLSGPGGEAARGLVAESLRDPELARVYRSRIIGSGPTPMLEVLRRAAARGEARPEAVNPLVASAGPALLRQHFWAHGPPIPDDLLTAIVDEVIVPLARR